MLGLVKVKGSWGSLLVVIVLGLVKVKGLWGSLLVVSVRPG